MIKMYLNDCTTEVTEGQRIENEVSEIEINRETLPMLVKNNDIVLKDDSLLTISEFNFIKRIEKNIGGGIDIPYFLTYLRGLDEKYHNVFRSLILREVESIFEEMYSDSIIDHSSVYVINSSDKTITTTFSPKVIGKFAQFRTFEDASFALRMIDKIANYIELA